ncbi:MAG: NAD-dependent DNA ligase LigA [Treponema sp.]|jgi:DNA ligase (NAD+)|nr:NAD-dependent DNA ligase LigA [Treponema sp.]
MIRIKELETLISRYQSSYYNGEGEVSDAEFDALWEELKSLDPGNPLLARVGADSGNFPKARHKMPMGSQDKAANPEEFFKWAEKHAYDEYLVEYKLDGASLELQYEGGVLARAVTRGDGAIGDDITPNARKMQGVRGRLEIDGALLPLTGGVRGEVIMPRETHKQYFADKANCRNAANGLMKRKDGEGSEHLCFVAYDAQFADAAGGVTVEAQPFADEEAKIRWLKRCGFTAVPLKICKTPQEVADYRQEVAEARPSLKCDIDGLVVKERRLDFADASRPRPDCQIAFKFSPERAVSIVRAVEWSESGATYTPIALFDPVELAGTTVKRASLVNPNTIRQLGVRIGISVAVTKRGEIIPKIEGLALPGEGADVPVTEEPAILRDIEFPTVCGRCGAELIDEGTRLYCPNPACPKRVHHRLEKWAAALDIRDLGVTLIRNLFNAGRLRSISDLYTLTEEELAPYFLEDESLAKDKKSKGAQKVLASLSGKTETSLAAFVAGFDIEDIGELLIEKLADAGFDTLDKLLAAAPEDVAAVNGFADITAAKLAAGLAENREEMLRLTRTGVIRLRQETRAGKLAGKSFCFTGELSIKRADAEQMVKEAGGSVKPTVAKGLSCLVTNDIASGSAKNKKAAGLGIPVIDEQAFLALF